MLESPADQIVLVGLNIPGAMAQTWVGQEPRGHGIDHLGLKRASQGSATKSAALRRGNQDLGQVRANADAKQAVAQPTIELAKQALK